MTNAAVLPDPVLAIPTTSFPSKIAGIALRCMGVGRLYPFRLIPLRITELSPRVSAGTLRLDSTATALRNLGRSTARLPKER